MVSFSCEVCNDTVAKKKLDQHRNQCRGATFTCLDCMVHFQGTDYRSHTSCISEAQKYQGQLYREKDKKSKAEKRRSLNGHDMSQAMVPRKAYVEDAPEGDESLTIAVVDVPPRAPTPPPAPEQLTEDVNVFDFLVSEDGPANGITAAPIAADDGIMTIQPTYPPYDDSQYSQYSNGAGPQYQHHGFSYGYSPVYPAFDRYDSLQDLNESQQSQRMMPPPAFTTPAPKEQRKEKKEKLTSEKSDKKRKRHLVEELDLSSSRRPTSRDEHMPDAPPLSTNGRVLHSGLTGGLSKLITDVDFYDDRIAAGPTPISPIKRSKRNSDADAKKDRRKSSYTSYSTTTIKPSSDRHGETSRRHHRSRSHERGQSHHHDKERRRQRHESFSSDDRNFRSTARHLKAIEYTSDRPERPASVQPHAGNQVVTYHSRADLFLSYVKGPESIHGYSFNKVLKRYHRERDVRGEEKEEDDKELWKSLRLRRNDRGEIVLFID